MEHTHPIDRSFSWRGAALALGLVVVIVLAVLGGRALVGRLSGTRPVAATGRVRTGHVRPRSAASVLVLNGNGRAGAAGGVSNRLLHDGYRSAFATNAQVTTYAQSMVLYRAGWEREAARLAKDAHIRAVAPLDGPAGSRYPLVVIVGH